MLAKRAKNREVNKNLFGQLSSNNQESTIETPSSLTNQGASSQGMAVQEHQETMPLLAPVGEQLRTVFQLHDLLTVSKGMKKHMYCLTREWWQELKHWNLKTESSKQNCCKLQMLHHLLLPPVLLAMMT